MVPSLAKAKTPTWTEELLRQSLLSEELIDIHFHLFASRSKSSGSAVNVRTLHANAVLLKKSAKYFADLLGPETSPSGTMLMDVKLDDEIFGGLALGDYGYESDSDLEDEDNDEDEDEKDDPDDDRSVDADITGSNSFVSATADSVKDYDLLEKEDSNTTTPTGGLPGRPTAHKPSGIVSIPSKGRHIFIKDTAFQTWYCLMYYLYTGEVHLLPPKSSGNQGSRRLSLNASEEPRCSAKSMFRLAIKLNLDELREHAFSMMNESLDERNLLQELASGFVGRYPRVLEMELDMLSQTIATAPIIEGLPALMRRISQKELPHGADIIIGLHTRILRLHYARELAQIQPRSLDLAPVRPPPRCNIPEEELGFSPIQPVVQTSAVPGWGLGNGRKNISSNSFNQPEFSPPHSPIPWGGEKDAPSFSHAKNEVPFQTHPAPPSRNGLKSGASGKSKHKMSY
ncbi:hypothetical protein SCLCIDRAFT_28761 [Scleroderma citrinum Foug A]|uniref:BTB domain-containing protein n=1 Tax=Scleroderma citrinum Foug A TaxID=1036808 RepID=A0A0C3DMS3_9AGAM|nr:hypothetical protein SCLCIDRAFT_28761 [Scleroderma citrinum Foug A]